MAIKKSELYSSLWQSCDSLRGGMDASQYKDYVLFMLFIKYVSDKYGNSDDFSPPVTIPAGASFSDMVKLKGKSDIGDKVNTQIIQPLIDHNTRLARTDFPDFNDPNKLGEGQAMVDRLTDLISIFQKPELDFSKNRADHDDILGDAYEYLMRHFASESGKSKGQFYTPSEVSRIMAKVIGISPDNAVASTTAYDPTCGSGSLLLKVAAEAGKHITLEGQEKDVTTAGLARMNMILHDFPTANILSGNTLSNPKFEDNHLLRTYDFVVANPPFSDKKWSTGLTPANDKYQRFEWGTPPAKQGDYAYLLHIIRSMKSSKGKAACILPHGVLFRGNAEAVIRRQLVLSGYLKGIIGLPANLFYGTGIPACILVLDKENAAGRKGIYMIDASKGFVKDGNKNRLREQDIHRIVDTFRKQSKIDRYARMVRFDEISDPKNDYNLNLPRYIDSTTPEDIQDIEGHLRGGIPNQDIDLMDHYWQELPDVRKVLFKRADRTGYSQLRQPIDKAKQAILVHDEFSAFKAKVNRIFDKWQKNTIPRLNDFGIDSHPKQLIETISEELLADFGKAPLMDPYDVYQRLMTYWADTMQDDCYFIAADGWVAQTSRVYKEITSGAKKGQTKDVGWTCDLVPKELVVARYFADEQAALDNLQAELDTVVSNLAELADEHGGEEGILKDVSKKTDAQDAYNDALIALWNEQDKTSCDEYNKLIEQAAAYAAEMSTLKDHHALSALKNSKGNLTLKAINERLKNAADSKEKAKLNAYLDADRALKDANKQAKELLETVEPDFLAHLNDDPLSEEYTDLQATVRYLALLDEQARLKAEVKVADEALDLLAYEKYPELTEDETKTLVIDDKWLAKLSADVQAEIDRVSQALTSRVRVLAERYETPLPKLTDKVEELSAKVNGHLKKMGFAW